MAVVEELQRPNAKPCARHNDPGFSQLLAQLVAELLVFLPGDLLGDLPDRPEVPLVRGFVRVMCVRWRIHQDVRSESDQEERDEVFTPVAGPDPDGHHEDAGHYDRVREVLGMIAEAILEPWFILVPEGLLSLELGLLGPYELLEGERQVGPGRAEAEEEREPEGSFHELPRRRLGHGLQDVRADVRRDRAEGERRDSMRLNLHRRYSV